MTEQKSNIEILNEIRNSRNEQLKDIGRNDIFVIKVEAIGVGANTNKRFFRLIEEKEILDPKTENPEIDEETGEIKKEIWEWFYEYEDVPKIIAVRNPNTKDLAEEGDIKYNENDIGKGIMPLGLSMDEKELWNSERDDIVQCLEERERELKAIAKELGISEKEINSLSEIELSQKVNEKQIDEEQKGENEPKQLSEEEVKKVGMTGMNEVKLDSRIDEKGTELGKVLNLEGYTKLLVVHSYKLAELSDSEGKQGRNTRNKFNLIAQKEDGTYETLSKTKLEQDRGSNDRILEANNKDNVEIKKEDCRFRVPGTNYSLIINQKDPYGIPDVYLAQNTRDNDGQMAQKLQDKYDGTERQDVEVRALFNQNRGIDQADRSVEEARGHQEAGCDDLDIDEVDGREDTGHIHFNPDSQDQQNAIEKIIEKSAAGPDSRISREEAERLFEAKLAENRGEITPQEAAEEIIDEMEHIRRR